MEVIENLKQMLQNTYEKYKMNVAYQMENKQILYKEFIEDINSLGTKLISLGLKNERIGIIAENRYEWEIAYFSIICGTGIVVPIDKSLTKSEIQRIIKRADIKAIFCSDKYIDNYKNVKYIISMDLKEEKDNILSQRELIKQGRELINQGNVDFINTSIDSDKLATILFTSGTTDKSKAVALSHKNICSNLTSTQKIYDINEKDVVLSVLPLSHVLEGLFCLLLSISRGAKRIHCNDISQITNYMRKYKITFMGNVPAVYDVIYNDIDNEIAQNINFLFCGGAYLSKELIRKYQSKNIKLLQGYGMTENSPAISLEDKVNFKLGSCGKVIPGVQTKLMSTNEEGIGELAIKGNSVMLGYFNCEEETEKVLHDGWLLTGDLVRIDEEGYVFICGRSKDVIVLENGKKVFPEELEEKLNAVDIIQESMVFGNENKIYAKIVSSNKKKYDTNIIWKYIQEINEELPEFKKIRKIFVTEDNIEKTSSGKLKRDEEKNKSLTHLHNPRLWVGNPEPCCLHNKILKGESESKEVIEKCNIGDIVKQVIAKQLDIDLLQINGESNITKDLMADSLDKVGIILNIEKALDIKIPKENYADLIKVDDFIKCAITIKKLI